MWSLPREDAKYMNCPKWEKMSAALDDAKVLRARLEEFWKSYKPVGEVFFNELSNPQATDALAQAIDLLSDDIAELEKVIADYEECYGVKFEDEEQP